MTGYRLTIRNVDYATAEWFRDLAYYMELPLGAAFERAVDALAEAIDAEEAREEAITEYQAYLPS